MRLFYLLALLGMPILIHGGSYEDLSWYVKHMMSGQLGILGQSVRVPSSLFTKSACQLVYMASPDYATSQVYVDFGSAPVEGCTRQAFLVYVDGYNTPDGVTGLGSKADVPWASLLTAPGDQPLPDQSATSSDGATSPSSAPSSDPASPTAGPASSPQSSTSPGVGSSRRRELAGIDMPLDRERFGTRYDNLRDRLDELVQLLNSDGDLIPEWGGLLSSPVLAAGYFQRRGAVPSNQRPYLDYVERQQLLAAAGMDTPITGDPPAGTLTDRLRVYSPLPKECLDVMSAHRKEVLGPLWTRSAIKSGNSSRGFTLASRIAAARNAAIASAGAGAAATAAAAATAGGDDDSEVDTFSWNPITGYSQDTCFVTQQAVLIYNDCPVNATPAARASAGAAADNRTRWYNCSEAAGDLQAEIACVLEAPLLQQATQMGYVPNEYDARIMIVYSSYDRCYRTYAQVLGQTGIQLIFFTAGIIVLLTFILLTPTFFRLFISFPCRCIAYAFRKRFSRGRVNNTPFDSGLHSYKEAMHPRCYEYPVIKQLLAARKHLLYAMCTIHSADGQYRALQVTVTSSVALMICMMSFSPNIRPPLEFFIPPFTFKIERVSDDPLASVWYFLTILAYSLYLGFIGYLAMLCNYNRPRNRYYLTQCILSVFFMLVLDALVLMHVTSILVYWDRLDPAWPWLPMTVFQLANLAVANLLQLVILFSSEDRRTFQRRMEYLALMDELRLREAHLAKVRAAQRQAAARKKEMEEEEAAAAAAGPPAIAATAVVTGSSSSGGSGGAAPDEAAAPPAGSLRRRAALASKAGEPAAGGSSSSSPVSRQQRRPEGDFDDLSAIGRADAPRGPVAEAAEGGGQEGSRTSPVASSGEAVGGAGWVRVPGRSGPSDGSGSGSGSEGSGGGSSQSSPTGVAAAVAPLPSGPSGRVRSVGGRAASLVNLQSLRRRWREKQAPGWLVAGWGKVARPLREDAAFRYPAWLLSALLVSAFMLVFTYARAMCWAHVIGECMTDPAECVNNNMARYLVFTTRLLGRDWQVRVRDTLDAVAASQESLQAVVDGALAGNNTMPLLDNALGGFATNLTTTVTDVATDQISALLATDVAALVNETLGADMAAYIPANQTAAFQARMKALVATRLGQVNLTSYADPLAQGLEMRILKTLNVTMTQFYSVVKATSNVFSISIHVTNELGNWAKELEARFFWCSLAGFTLGLLLGLSSLLRTAISFRKVARRLRLARIARRVLASEYDSDGGGGRWAMTNFRSVYEDENSIVHRAEATTITLVVFFFGVLLSTAIVQLYAVGVVLSAALAVVTHPWTWTWLLPRYYMWLVAVIVGVILNKVILIGFIGNTWLSDGDHIYRPAAWLAFLVIASATNLVIGLLLAVYRIVLLLLIAIFALGKLDETIFTMLEKMDLPHQTFLAGLHLQESMSHFDDPIYLPGPRGRAHRRWRNLKKFLATHKAAKLQELALGKGANKSVEDQVLVVVPDSDSALPLSYGAGGAAGPRIGPGPRVQPPPPPPPA